MPDVFLVAGETNPNDVRLIDPSQSAAQLAAVTTVALSTIVALTITPVFAATSEIDLATAANLNVQGPLVADTTVSVSTSAQISQDTSLAAASSFAWSTSGGSLV